MCKGCNGSGACLRCAGEGTVQAAWCGLEAQGAVERGAAPCAPERGSSVGLFNFLSVELGPKGCPNCGTSVYTVSPPSPGQAEPRGCRRCGGRFCRGCGTNAAGDPRTGCPRCGGSSDAGWR